MYRTGLYTRFNTTSPASVRVRVRVHGPDCMDPPAVNHDCDPGREHCCIAPQRHTLTINSMGTCDSHAGRVQRLVLCCPILSVHGKSIESLNQEVTTLSSFYLRAYISVRKSLIQNQRDVVSPPWHQKPSTPKHSSGETFYNHKCHAMVCTIKYNVDKVNGTKYNGHDPYSRVKREG